MSLEYDPQAVALAAFPGLISWCVSGVRFLRMAGCEAEDGFDDRAIAGCLAFADNV
jgi:hypothetical protein